MAVFPLIQSPCPYKGRLTDILDGDLCRLCDRQVHDLTGMGDAAKRAFLKGCSGEVCVTYRLTAGAAAALSAMVASTFGPAVAEAQVQQLTERVIVIGGGIGMYPAEVSIDKAMREIHVSLESVPVPVIEMKFDADRAKSAPGSGMAKPGKQRRASKSGHR